MLSIKGNWEDIKKKLKERLDQEEKEEQQLSVEDKVSRFSKTGR